MTYHSYNYGKGGWFGTAPEWAEVVIRHRPTLNDRHGYGKFHQKIEDWLENNTDADTVKYLTLTVGDLIKVKVPHDDKFVELVNTFLIPEDHDKLEIVPKYMDATVYIKMLEDRGWTSIVSRFEDQQRMVINDTVKSRLTSRYYQYQNTWVFENEQDSVIFVLYYL